MVSLLLTSGNPLGTPYRAIYTYVMLRSQIALYIIIYTCARSEQAFILNATVTVTANKPSPISNQ